MSSMLESIVHATKPRGGLTPNSAAAWSDAGAESCPLQCLVVLLSGLCCMNRYGCGLRDSLKV